MDSDLLTKPAADPFPPLTPEQEAWIARRKREIDAALNEAHADVSAGRVERGSIAEMVAQHLAAQPDT